MDPVVFVEHANVADYMPMEPAMVIHFIKQLGTRLQSITQQRKALIRRSRRVSVYSLFLMTIPLVLRSRWIRRTFATYLSYDLFFPFARAPVNLFALCLVTTTLFMAIALDQWKYLARFFWLKHQLAWHVAFSPIIIDHNNNNNSSVTNMTTPQGHHFRSRMTHFYKTLETRLRRAHQRVKEPTRLLDERLEKSTAVVKELYVDYVVSILIVLFLVGDHKPFCDLLKQPTFDQPDWAHCDWLVSLSLYFVPSFRYLFL
ncbi:hypothetical protein BCR42DRAFT_395125 [Absidia repens]|uniref:Uncharacterized protein n=1 Tax=Absidia repens TaxID=90262 RepID=A0A1X2I8C4_9FUNG|nr:hypothetical protein BCR42DRAFT_395125 [Absidia repens]